RKHGLGSMLVICEATGGYEHAVLKAASELGLDCHLAHGSSVRAYAKFRGRHAKSDPIDAVLIAEYGRDKPDLKLYQPPRPEEAALRALMGRRAELKDMIQAETQFNHRSKLMQTLAGIGTVAAHTILAFCPEIGHIPSSAAVALVGLAPYDRDSGKERAKRRIFAGRSQIRTCLYMAALAAIRSHTVFRAFAERLTRRGKPFKVAITAVMRKLVVILSAMLKENKPHAHPA